MWRALPPSLPVAAAAVTVIYGPPVARTSDLYDDTELAVPLLVICSVCTAKTLQPSQSDEQGPPSNIVSNPLYRPPGRWAGKEKKISLRRSSEAACFDSLHSDMFIFHTAAPQPCERERYGGACAHACAIEPR